MIKIKKKWSKLEKSLRKWSKLRKNGQIEKNDQNLKKMVKIEKKRGQKCKK